MTSGWAVPYPRSVRVDTIVPAAVVCRPPALRRPMVVADGNLRAVDGNLVCRLTPKR
jgi:hypothetical protein